MMVKSRSQLQLPKNMPSVSPVASQAKGHLDVAALSHLTDDERIELALRLVQSCSDQLQAVSRTVDRLSPLLKRDFLSLLPSELALSILSYLDLRSLSRLPLVSKSWYSVLAQEAVWREAFHNQNGWVYNEIELEKWMNSLGKERRAFSANSHLHNHKLQRRKNVHDDLEMEIDSPPTTVNMDDHDHVATQDSALSAMSPSTPSSPSHAQQQSRTQQPLWKELYKERMDLDQHWYHKKYVITRLKGHREGIYCLQFDENKLVSGSRDNTIRIWDLKNPNNDPRLLEGHTASVLCLQYDATKIISGSSDSTIKVWSLETGAVTHSLSAHTESVLNLRFSPTTLVTCSKDRLIKIWDLETMTNVGALEGHKAAINCIQYVGNLVVSASGDRNIMVWDLRQRREVKALQGHTRGIACVAFDGTHIVSGSSDHTIKVWNMHSSSALQTLEGHKDLVRSVDFNSKFIVSGSYDETIRVWDFQNGTLVGELTGGHERSRIYKVVVDGVKIGSCGQDTDIVFWNFGNELQNRLFGGIRSV